jgi:hypothetical protein
MDILFVYILPVILVILECIFLRTSVAIPAKSRYGEEPRYSEESARRVPRLLILFLVIISLVPILGLVEAVLIPIIILANNWEIKDNRFTRFWIKS